MAGRARRVHATVLGGGVSGLSTGWFLRRMRGGDLTDITVLESAQRAGGWVNSTYSDGHILESGPRGFRPQGRGLETLSLAEQLGLEDELIAADPSAKMRYLYLDGKLQQLPTGLADAYRNPTTKWLPPVLKLEMKKVRWSGGDESIADFITRRFNKRVLDELVDPLVSGIYAGDPAKLSVRSCFKMLHELEQTHGSVVKGIIAENVPWPMGQGSSAAAPLLDRGPPASALGDAYAGAALVSFRGGMSTLTDAMASQLGAPADFPTPTGAVLYGAEAAALDFSSPEAVDVRLADGRVMPAQHIFSTLPAPAAANLLEKHSAELAAELRSIEYAPVALVTLAWDEDVLPVGLRGFGHLVPAVSKQEVIGITWDSCTFPQQGLAAIPTRLTVFIGGSRKAAELRASAAEGEAALATIAKRALQSHLGVTAEPNFCHVHYMPSAIPQYVVGHIERVERIERLAAAVDPRLTLGGSSLYGVAINDIVAHARQTALLATMR